MNQAFLLCAGNGIIACVEIGDQNATELLEHPLSSDGLTILTINKGHFLQVCKHPDVCILSSDSGPGFIRMHERAAHNLVKDGLIHALATFRDAGLEAIDHAPRCGDAEYLSHALSHCILC